MQKALIKHFPQVKETTAQELEAIKALLFYRKRTLLLRCLLGMGNPITEKQKMEGKYDVVYGTPEVDTAKTTN